MNPHAQRISSRKFACLMLIALLTAFVQHPALSEEVAKNQQAQTSIISLEQQVEEILDKWRFQNETLDNAAQLLSLALKQNPDSAKAHMELARLHIMARRYKTPYFEQSSPQAAEAELKKALEIDPKFANAYVLLGHLYTNSNRAEDAKIALQAAEKIGTDSPWLALNWATILDAEGQHDLAAAKYQSVIDGKTKNLKALSVAYTKLEAFYANRKNAEKVAQLYKAHTQANPLDPWTHGNYASELLFIFGDIDNAIVFARKALAISDYGHARRTLAMALYCNWAKRIINKKDLVNAQKYFKEAQSLYPDLEQVKDEALDYPSTQIISEALSRVKK